MSKLKKELIKLFQRTIDYDDKDRQYIGFLADKSIEIVTKHLVVQNVPLTQKQLADYCGVSRQTVSRWCNNPDIIKLHHLSKILKLSDLLE